MNPIILLVLNFPSLSPLSPAPRSLSLEPPIKQRRAPALAMSLILDRIPLFDSGEAHPRAADAERDAEDEEELAIHEHPPIGSRPCVRE